MEQQTSLFGIEEPPGQINDLFVALLPDQPALQRIGELKEILKRQNGSPGNIVPLDKSHVTLVYIDRFHGDIPRGALKSASDACRLAARFSSFPLCFDHVKTFRGKPGRLPLVISGGDPATLMEFQGNLLKRLIYGGFPCKENPRFNPHLTLSRVREEMPEQMIEPIGWIANEIVLVQSLVGLGKHIHLDRWPLRLTDEESV